MTLVPWRGKRNGTERELSSPLNYFRSEMDNLFDRFFNGPWDLATSGGAATMQWPSLDVMETDDEVVVRAEVPGVDPKDLDISLSGQTLTLSGEKKSASEKKGENFFHTERYFGSFRRMIELPSPVDAENLKAEQKNGLIEIRMKKEPSMKPKRIPVKTT